MEIFAGSRQNVPPFCGRPVPSCATEGPVQRLIVLLHGYGADGHNLMPLAHLWAESWPGTLLVSPHAADLHPAGGGGFQWFDLEPDPLTGGLKMDLKAWGRGVDKAADLLVPWIWNLADACQLPMEKVAIAGFSQGGMMALHLGIYRMTPGAVVSFSGMLLPTTRKPVQAPPVLLVHGAMDEVVPVQAFRDTRARLDQLAPGYTPLLLPGEGHTIPAKAAGAGKNFLLLHLGKQQERTTLS